MTEQDEIASRHPLWYRGLRAVVAVYLVGLFLVAGAEYFTAVNETQDDDFAEPDCSKIYVTNGTDGHEVRTTEAPVEECEIKSGDDLNLTWYTETPT